MSTKTSIVAAEYILNEMVSSDIKNIYKGLSNKEITKYYAVHFQTLEATEEQMEWYRILRKEGTGIWWGIYEQKDQKFCGAVGFNHLDQTHKKAEIGLWLLKKYWGKGILKIVMPKIFEYGFNALNLNRIEGFVDSDNAKCKKALEKIKFNYEGTMRSSEIKNGVNIDVEIYSILKSEWGH